MTLRPTHRTWLRRATAGLAATGVAAGLMTAAWAVPARADERDVAKIIAGIAAIALIAKAIDDSKDRKANRKADHEPAVTQHHQGYDRQPDRPFVPGDPYDDTHDDTHDSASRVPVDCALEVQGGRRNRTAYAESCLVSYGFRHLPRDCAYHATIFGRADRLYPAACLREAGFRLPRK